MQTPRYLFRAFSPSSAGRNSADDGFDSLAKAAGHSHITSLAQVVGMSSLHARAMLQHHVLWQSARQDPRDDLLISFTSSLPYALYHALRKIKFPPDPFPASTLENTFLAIVDTAQYPAATFRWIPDALLTFGLTEASAGPAFRQERHTAEYFAQFALPIRGPHCARCVSLHVLLHQGELAHAIPRLALDTPNLDAALARFRSAYDPDEDPVTGDIPSVPCDDQQIEQARRLAACFGGKWFYPVMLWALAAEPRAEDDPFLTDRFMKEFDDTKDDDFSWADPNSGNDTPENVYEVVEWFKMMRMARRVKQGSWREQLRHMDSEVEFLNLND